MTDVHEQANALLKKIHEDEMALDYQVRLDRLKNLPCYGADCGHRAIEHCTDRNYDGDLECANCTCQITWAEIVLHFTDAYYEGITHAEQ